jgi:hypothetical protein
VEAMAGTCAGGVVAPPGGTTVSPPPPPPDAGGDVNTELAAALNRGDFGDAFRIIKTAETSGKLGTAAAQSLRQQTHQQAVRFVETQLGRGNLDRRLKLLDLVRPYGDVSGPMQKVQVDWEAQLAGELNSARDNMEYAGYAAKLRQLKARFPNSAEADRLLAAIHAAKEEMDLRKKARQKND